MGRFADLVDDDAPRANLALQFGVESSPDETAEAVKLARRYNLPPGVALEFREDYRAKAKADDAKAAVENAPKLKGWLAYDDNNARMAHDDVQTLAQMEDAVRRFGELKASKGPEVSLKSVASGILSAFPQGARLMSEGVSLQVSDLFDALGMAPEPTLKAERMRRMAQEQARVEASAPAFESSTARGLYSGGTSLLRQVPGLAASIALRSPAPALATAGLQVEAEAYGKYRARGATPGEALAGGLGEAAVEIATEKLPMGFIVDKFGKTGAKQFLAGMFAREVPSEQVATFLQDAIDTAVANPDKTWGEFMAERPDAAYQTLLATVVQSGVMGTANAVANRLAGPAQGAQQAEEGAAHAETLSKLAEASALRQRDTQTFRELVADLADEQGDAPTELFIDGAMLANSLNQSGMTLREFRAVAPVAAQQLANAAQTGGTVRVPVAEFATAGEALTGPLIDHLRVSEDAMTRAEAQEYLKAHGDTIQAEVERELRQRQEADAARQSSEAVRAQFENELNAVGRFTPDVNKAYASLLSSFYGATAARLGMTPEALLQRYGLRVSAQDVAGAQTLNQRDTNDAVATENGVAGQDASPRQSGDTNTGAAEDYIELFHGSPEDSLSVVDDRSDSRFGGVFASGQRSAAASHGENTVYSIRVPRSSVLRSYELLYEIPNEDVEAALRKAMPWLEDEDYDLAYLAVVEDKSHKLDEGDLLRIFREDDAGQAGFEAQRVRGQVARELGYQAVEMDDEHGTSYLVLPGAELTRESEQDSPQGGGVLNQGERGRFSFSADLTKTPSVISLLKGADLSTFIHEGGHFFLEATSDIASRIQGQIRDGASVTDAERAVVADMEVLLQWFGVEGGLAEWERMTFEQKTGAHEQFARGFEAYAFEGKAPSLELQSIFQRFRSWLVNIYRQLRNLNVELTDDVRAVMGRMIATEGAIEEAEAQRAMGPLFRDAESAGMTAQEYSAYQATGQAATAQAVDKLQERSLKDMKWLSRARDKALKARQDEVDELRREIRREVTSEILSQPVYRAWQFLSGKADAVDTVTPGMQPVGEIDTIAQKGKLRTSIVKELAPQWETLSKRRMTSEDKGMHPDIVAEMFGFDSGDALVKALLEARSPRDVIAEATDARMLERHGDINSPDALQRAADEAVHNEARARFITAELKALQEATTVRADTGQRTATGRRVTVDVMARAAKDYAAQIIERLRIRDIRPAQYAAAEVRNAKQAEKAFAAGKTEEAATHKRNQLINNYATRAAYEAQAEVQAAVRYFRRFDKRSKAIDPSYLDQIEQLLERFEFRAVSLKEIDRRKSLTEWYAEQVKMGAEPSLPPEVLNEAGRKSYKDMTLEEIRGLRDSIKQIEHLGRLKNRLLTAKDQRDFDRAASEMAASIIANGGKARPVELEGPNPVVDWFAGAAAQHRKLASLFRQMDGNKDAGPMYELIGRGMNERGTAEDVMVEKATVRLRDIYAPILKLKGGVTGYRSKVFIPEINASLTRGGRLAVALNWGNEQNRQRVMDGDGWSEAQVSAVLRTLTPAELQFVNEVWEYLDSYWPEIAAKEKRLTGVEPEKVEAMPFMITAADGTQVQMRGGYYPLKYDAERSDRTDQQEAAQAAKEMMEGAFTRATTRRGHTKARLEEVGRPVRKDLNVITQHVTQVTHDLAWHEWLIDTNRLLGDERVAGAIRDHYGPRVLKTMRNNILGIATADVAPQDAIDKSLVMLRSNVTRSTMGASLTTAFLQPFGLTQSMVRIGPKHVLRGVARWAGDAARMESTLGWIRGKSEFMRLRSKTFNRELREISGSVAGKSKTMQAVDGGLFWLMQKMQLVADVPTWVGQYEKSIAEGLDEAAAVAMADRAVLEAQGGGQIKDLAEVQRKHPMLTQFYSYFSTTLNLTIEQTAATNFKNPRAVAGWLGDMALLLVIPALGPSFILHALKGGDDDDEKLPGRVIEWQVGYLMGMVVGLRELSGTISGYDYAGPPVGRIVVDLGKAGKQTAQGEVDEAAVIAYARLIGDAFGIPVTQIIRSYRGWLAWAEGDAPPPAVLLGPPPKD